MVYATAELSDAFPKGSAGRANLRAGHEMFGLLVFGLVWLRLAVRAFTSAPAIEPVPPRWQALLAKAAHIALYGLMIVLPLSGWLMLSAAGKPIPFFRVGIATAGRAEQVGRQGDSQKCTRPSPRWVTR